MKLNEYYQSTDLYADTTTVYGAVTLCYEVLQRYVLSGPLLHVGGTCLRTVRAIRRQRSSWLRPRCFLMQLNLLIQRTVEYSASGSLTLRG